MNIVFNYILAGVVLGASLSQAEIREWKNADKTKSFKGEYVSSTDSEVTLIKGFTKVTVKQEILSKEDREWIKVKAAEVKAEEAEKLAIEEARLAKEAAKTEFYKTLIKNLYAFDGRKYKKNKLEKVPKEYILYFGASW